MADIVNRVNRGNPPMARSVLFTQADAGAGDVLMVRDSLGRAGVKLSIVATAALSIRTNVYFKVYPRRPNDTIVDGSALPNMALGLRAMDTSGPIIALDAGETFELDNDIVISDIELVSVAGAFEIFIT